jgi:hydroxypyruvate isomerase
MMKMNRQDQDRRSFLKSAAGMAVSAPLAMGWQQMPAAPVPPPKKARITSSVMLWTLKGTFDEKLDIAADAGMQSVELIYEYDGWSDSDAARYKRKVASYGMHMDTILASRDWVKRPVSLVNPAHREAFLADVQHAVVWAKKLDVPQIILMSGNVQPAMTHEAQYASLVESAKRATDLAEAADVTLIIENLNSKVNHPGYFLTNAAEALKAVKEVDHPRFRFLYDLYHEYVQNGDPMAIMKEAEPYVAVYHVADAPGRHDPGTGDMKWADLYTAIGKSTYAGYVALEYLPVPVDQAGSLVKAVTAMRSSLNAAAQPEPRA